jgi:hypothetical protein
MEKGQDEETDKGGNYTPGKQRIREDAKWGGATPRNLNPPPRLFANPLTCLHNNKPGGAKGARYWHSQDRREQSEWFFFTRQEDHIINVIMIAESVL